LHQRVERLLRGLEDVEEPLVGADLELLARLLVHVRRPEHAVLVDLGGQGDRSRHLGVGASRRVHDLRGRLVEELVVIRLEPDANLRCRHVLLDDLGDNPSADRAAALADGEAQPLFTGDRRDELDVQVDVVPRHHHLHPLRQRHHPRHVRRAEVELRPVPLEERRVPPAPLLLQDLDLPPELLLRVDRPPPSHHPPPPPPLPPYFAPPSPRSLPSPLMPRRTPPMLSPARPSSRSLRNISTPVTTVFAVGRNPTISTSSPTLTIPRSTRPVHTVPRPVIVNTSSTGIRNGL